MELTVIDGGKALAVKRDYSGVPDDVLAGGIFNAEILLRAADDKHRSTTSELRDEIADMRACLSNRMAANHATRLAHDDLDITYEQRTQLTKRMNVLLGLTEIVPASELSKGLSATVSVQCTLDQIDRVKAALASFIFEDRIEVTYRADATKLKTLAKLGDNVRERLEAGLVHEPIGAPVLKIVEKQKALRNVTEARPFLEASDLGGAQ